MKRFTLFIILTSLILGIGGANAETQNYSEVIEGLDPMDLSEVDPKVAGILRKYYRYTFGDSLTWEGVESLSLEGEVELELGNFDFVIHRKKPDLMKLIIDQNARGSLVFCYNGEDAWQLNTLAPNAESVSMPEVEALNFIREAPMGGHLLYPQLKGKKFEFMGTASLEGVRFYELKTTLPSGQVIRSFFDMTSFAELYRIWVNNVNQNEELNKYSEFRELDGIRIPFTTTLFVDGEKVQQFRITKVRANAGAMPWIFNRTSAGSGTKMNPVADMQKSNDLFKPVEGSVFSIEGTDIWSTAAEIVGSTFQIESAGSSEGQGSSGLNDSNQKAEKSEE